jgi:hypothetical protein
VLIAAGRLNIPADADPVAFIMSDGKQCGAAEEPRLTTLAELIAMYQDQRTPGAKEITARYRTGSRQTTFEGGVYLQPTIVLCDSFAHPLANREFLFPYASVMQVPQSEMLKQIGPSLVVTAITNDAGFREALLELVGEFHSKIFNHP